MTPIVTEVCAGCGKLFKQTGRKRICAECFGAGKEDERANRQWFLGFDNGLQAARAVMVTRREPGSPFDRGFKAGLRRGMEAS